MRKRYLVQAAAFNLGLLMRALFGVGTPRGAADRLKAVFVLLRTLVLWGTSRANAVATALHRPEWHSPSALTTAVLGHQARTSTGC